MPSTYSSNLKIELQATGENSGTWGTITNTNLGTALEQAIVGYGNPVFASDANLTLTYTDTNAAQAARALVLNVTSGVTLTATRELIVPTIQKQYIVQNNTTGSQSITVKTAAGTGITIPNGRKAHLYVDGTNVIQMFDFVDINGGTIDGTTQATGTINGPIAAGGTWTAAATWTLPALTLGGTVTSNGQSFSGTIANLGTVTTADINGGTLDGTVIGGASAAAATVTTLTARAANAIRSEAAATQDAVILAGRAGGTNSWAVTLTPTTLSASRTLTLPDLSGTVAVINAAQTFTSAQTFRAASAIRSEAASTQDAVVIAGRAGGTGSWAATITPATLSANRTVTIPDDSFTIGFRNIPQSGTDKTTSYTLATTDVGEFVGVGSGGSITIPDATFAAGDVVSVFNNTSGNVTITCTITTAYIAGTDSDKASVTLATRGVATILFLSSTVCVITGNVS